MGRTLESLGMDIHSPSIETPTLSKTAQSLHKLLEEKTILEGTLAQLDAVLVSHGVGMRNFILLL